MRYREIPLDETRKLRFTVNAMRELEKYYGGGLNKVFSQENIGFDQLTVLVRIALKHGGNPKSWAVQLTDEKVGDMIQEFWLDADKPMNELYTIVLEALQTSGFIEQDKSAKKDMSQLPPA